MLFQKATALAVGCSCAVVVPGHHPTVQIYWFARYEDQVGLVIVDNKLVGSHIPGDSGVVLGDHLGDLCWFFVGMRYSSIAHKVHAVSILLAVSCWVVEA